MSVSLLSNTGTDRLFEVNDEEDQGGQPFGLGLGQCGKDNNIEEHYR